MKTKLLFIVGLIAFMAVITTGCSNGSNDPPVPVAQTKTLKGFTTYTGGTVDVVINYTAVPGSVPGYMGTLEIVLRNIFKHSLVTATTLTINVNSSGADGFVVANSKTLNVRESWISNATENEMGESMYLATGEWGKN